MRHKFFVALFTVAYIVIGGSFVNADESSALQNNVNGSAVKTEAAISNQYSDHQSGEPESTEEVNGPFSAGNEITGNEETGVTIDAPEQQDVQNKTNSIEENKNEVEPVTGTEENCDSWVQENGNKYYLDKTGEKVKGIAAVSGNVYYFDKETGALKASAGWVEWNGERYFTDASGKAYVNQFITFGPMRYYMGSDGSAQTGIFTAADGRMYNADETGLVISKAQWIEQNGKRYFANGNGQLYQNQMITFGAQKYYMGSDGSAQTGIFTAADGRMYNADETGLVISKAQWIEQKGKRYYSDASGELYRNRFISFGSTYYYMGADGAAVTTSFTKWGDVYNPDQTGAIVNMPEGFWFWSRISSVAESLGNSLWNAYNWVAGFSRYYLTSNGRTSWPIMSSRDYAIYGLDHRGGDCIVMASTLRYIAQYLGYNAIQRFGYVGSATHSWVEINGKVYDSNFKNETGRNGFGISYGQRGTWKYRIVTNI